MTDRSRMDAPQAMSTAKKATAAGGIAVAIAAAVLIATPLTKLSEGKVNRGYLDPVRIPTACFGHTGKDVRVGARYSDAQCESWLTADQTRLATAAASCLPEKVVRNRYVMASVADFAFNGGAGLFCKSTMARRFRAGDIPNGCSAYSMYIYAGRPPRVLNGLVKRRQAEMALCFKGA